MTQLPLAPPATTKPATESTQGWMAYWGAHFASDTMEKKAPRAGMTLKELADAAGR